MFIVCGDYLCTCNGENAAVTNMYMQRQNANFEPGTNTDFLSAHMLGEDTPIQVKLCHMSLSKRGGGAVGITFFVYRRPPLRPGRGEGRALLLSSAPPSP